MPNPIEPSPMTATCGFAISGMRHFLDGFWLALCLWVTRLGLAAKA
jgi:hypothetical protein